MIENEGKAETNDEQFQQDDYAINTGAIFSNEFMFIKDPDSFNVKKCPLELGRNLEHIIQELLVKFVDPTVDYSDDRRDYLIDRFDKFSTSNFSIELFRINYFVTAYDKPGNKNRNNRLSFAGGNYFYLYSYDEPLLINKKAIENYQFELLFAFALRQCDLMYIAPFLQYHLLTNFDGKPKQYCHYLKQINRKFSTSLFTTELSDSISDWISENEKKVDAHNSRKIKTYLTVDQLACLFKILMDNGHLSDEPTRNIEGVCASFESKMMEDLSTNNFGQDFYKPPAKALDFWIDNFDKMAKRAIRMKEKKGT